MKTAWRLLWCLGAALGTALPAAAEPASTRPAPLAEARRIVDRPDERICVLENGLTVILKTHRTAPVASVQMFCRTGSVYEQEYAGSGISHLFEHLLHGSATTTRGEEESRRILDEIGGDTNAYTGMEETCYYVNAARAHVSQSLNLLSDWVTRPAFPQAAFDRERGVVQRELERDLDDPDRQLFYLTLATMYRAHPARYPVIGHQPLVQALTKDDVVAYYRRMYVPDNIVVCIVGDIGLDQTLAAVRQEFASFARRRTPTITLPVEPPMVAPRYAVKRMKVQAAILRWCWPSIPLTHPDLYALDVLSYVLTEGESSRLVRTIRDRGLTYTIESMSWTPAWGDGLFAVTARLDPAKIDPATAALDEQIKILQEQLIDEAELHKAQQQKAAQHVFETQTAESIAALLARDYLATGDAHFSQTYVDNIRKVTAEQIREMARKYLLPQRLATILIVPEDYQQSVSAERQAAAPEPIRKFVLNNGLRCLLRRDLTTPLVAIQAFSLGGVLFEDELTNGLSNLAALLAPRGTATRSARQVAEFFDARGGSLAGSAGSNTLYFQAQVLKNDFAAALEVFADVLCNPGFPAEELDNYRPRVLDQIRQINEQWRSELFAYSAGRFFEHSPYRFQVVGRESVIAGVKREQIAQFYRRLVTGPQTVVAVFGDFQPAEAEALLRKYFAALSAEPAALPAVPQEGPLTAPRLYVKRKSPERRVAGLQLLFPGLRITDRQDMAAVAVLDTIISGYRLPTGWLEEALRGGQRSLVYEVHAVNRPGLLPGYFGIYAACQPDKVGEVYRIINAELDRARTGRFTAAELARAKTIILTSELMEHQTNSERAMQAALDELYGLGVEYHEQFLALVNSIGLDEVRRVAAKYLTTPVIAVVTPEPDRLDLGLTPAAVDKD